MGNRAFAALPWAGLSETTSDNKVDLRKSHLFRFHFDDPEYDKLPPLETDLRVLKS